VLRPKLVEIDKTKMQIFDPRSIATPVYKALTELSKERNEKQLKEQKAQAFALYSYLSTWGMMRLKAEETAISGEGKKAVIKAYFSCLEELSKKTELAGIKGLQTITTMETEDYLGLTGLGLTLAQEFSFWATAIYVDVEIDGDE
jgi:hypothetical protein